MMYLVQAETYWIALATVRWVAAELRPVLRKTTSRGGAGLPGVTRSSLGGSERQGGATSGCYWLRMLRRRRILRAQWGHRRRAEAGKEERDDDGTAIYSRDELARLRQRTTEAPRRRWRACARESGEDWSAAASRRCKAAPVEFQFIYSFATEFI